MEFKTEQEVFDFVVDAIIKQGEPSTDGQSTFPRCLYRGPGGLKCTAGHLLSDGDIEFVRSKSQKLSIEHVVTNTLTEFLPQGHVIKRFPGLVANLQLAHDRVSQYNGDEFIEKFEEGANKVAADFKLKGWV